MACNDVLIQNVTVTSMNRTQQIAFLNTITQDNYQEHFKDIQAAATALGDFGVIDGSTDYQTFDQMRSYYNQSVGYSSNTTESTSLYSSSLSDVQVNAWLACMQAQFAAGGASGIVKYWDNQTVVVQFYFRPPPGEPQKYPLKVTPTNANPAVNDDLSPVEGEAHRTWTFTRHPGQEFILTVDVDNFATFDIELPVFTPPPPKQGIDFPMGLALNITTSHSTTTVYINEWGDFIGDFPGRYVNPSGKVYLSYDLPQGQTAATITVTIMTRSPLAALEVQYDANADDTPVLFSSVLGSFKLQEKNQYVLIPGL